MTQKMKRIALTRLSLGAHYTFHNMFRNLLELLNLSRKITLQKLNMINFYRKEML